MELHLHSFLNSAVGGDEPSVSFHFNPSTRYVGGWVGPRHFGEYKNFLLFAEKGISVRPFYSP